LQKEILSQLNTSSYKELKEKRVNEKDIGHLEAFLEKLLEFYRIWMDLI